MTGSYTFHSATKTKLKTEKQKAMSTINYNLAKRLAKFKGYRLNPESLFGRKLGATHLATPAQTNGCFKIGSTVCQWQENPGFTFVGNADAICRSIGHKGWFTREDSDGSTDDSYNSTCWGVVYKISHDRYLAGVTDSDNASRKNAERGPFIMEVGKRCIYDTKEYAASAADDLARIHAEKAREYSAKDCAEQDVERLKEENEGLLESAKELIQEMKQFKGNAAPFICAALWSKIGSARAKMSRNRAKGASLRERYCLA